MTRDAPQLSAGLEWLTSVLWSAPDLRVTLGGGAPPGYRPVESYAILPDARRARFLIPVAEPRSAAASVTAYNALRPPKVRAVRAAIGAGIRAGASRVVLRDRLTVSAPRGANDDELGEWLLSERLRRELDEPVVRGAIGIGRGGPFRKPVLQLFRPDGTAVGYVKTGWNEVTRGLVRTEGRMLAACAARRPGSMLVPGLLHRGSWRGLEIAVAAPLPSAIRRYRPRRVAPPLDATRDVAELFGRRSGPLAESAYWLRTRERLMAMAGRIPEEVSGAAASFARTIEERHGGERMWFGAWHGDWAPWNMARLGKRLVVWDWEHGAPDVPLGFDVLHFHFQLAFIADERPLDDALARTRRLAEPPLAGLDLSGEQIELTARLHTLEVFLRYQEAMLAGAGTNPRFFPAVIGVLSGDRARRGTPAVDSRS